MKINIKVVLFLLCIFWIFNENAYAFRTSNHTCLIQSPKNTCGKIEGKDIIIHSVTRFSGGRIEINCPNKAKYYIQYVIPQNTVISFKVLDENNESLVKDKRIFGFHIQCNEIKD
jgi:hypothetical protein